jgi:hypothetical protein
MYREMAAAGAGAHRVTVKAKRRHAPTPSPPLPVVADVLYTELCLAFERMDFQLCVVHSPCTNPEMCQKLRYEQLADALNSYINNTGHQRIDAEYVSRVHACISHACARGLDVTTFACHHRCGAHDLTDGLGITSAAILVLHTGFRWSRDVVDNCTMRRLARHCTAMDLADNDHDVDFEHLLDATATAALACASVWATEPPKRHHAPRCAIQDMFLGSVLARAMAAPDDTPLYAAGHTLVETAMMTPGLWSRATAAMARSVGVAIVDTDPEHCDPDIPQRLCSRLSHVVQCISEARALAPAFKADAVHILACLPPDLIAICHGYVMTDAVDKELHDSLPVLADTRFRMQRSELEVRAHALGCRPMPRSHQSDWELVCACPLGVHGGIAMNITRQSLDAYRLALAMPLF